MATAADFCAPKGVLRRETFREAGESIFQARVTALVEKAWLMVAAKVTDASVDVTELTEALVYTLAFEQAASIWAGLPAEEGVAGEASFKYLAPDELRKEATRYGERYAALLSAILTPTAPRRTGRLRRV
jgi:hypothetical protein